MAVIFSNIQKFYDDLSSTEQLAIDYILKYDDLPNIKLKIIEDELHISASTIIRAVKKLSYDSFNDFKYTLINHRIKKEKQEDIASYEKMLDNITTDFIQTIEMMDKRKVDR